MRANIPNAERQIMSNIAHRKDKIALVWATSLYFAIIPFAFGSLAQLVEQRTLNPRVAGSIPARPTKIKKNRLSGLFFLCFCGIFEFSPVNEANRRICSRNV